MAHLEVAAPAVLVADEDGAARTELVDLLTGGGFRVVEAHDGAEALRLLLSGAAAAAVVETGPSALELLDRLRGADNLVPVLLLSSCGGIREAVRAMQRGANDFLLRPVQPAALLDALREALLRGWRATAAQAEEQARNQARRFETFGRLTAGIVHDFNNLLTVVNGYAHLLSEGLGSQHPVRAYVDELLGAVAHGSALTKRLLAHGRKEPQPSAVDLNEVVSGAGRLLLPLLGPRVALTVQTAANPCPVKVDPAQMVQVLVNLTVNARDAMPDGGQVVVRVADDAVTGRVLLSVRDNGCGIDPATRARMFEPFFTTKPPGMGTGLGLPTVQGIVQQAGGHIEVETAPGEGTSFLIALPRAAQVPAVATPRAGCVLLVEGDIAQRAAARRALTQAGYHVLEAGDGIGALALTARYQGRIDLVICEAFPGWLAGRELAQRLRESWPKLACLLIGVDSVPGFAQQALPGARVALNKPYSPDQLVCSVREVLHGKAALVATA